MLDGADRAPATWEQLTRRRSGPLEGPTVGREGSSATLGSAAHPDGGADVRPDHRADGGVLPEVVDALAVRQVLLGPGVGGVVEDVGLRRRFTGVPWHVAH